MEDLFRYHLKELATLVFLKLYDWVKLTKRLVVLVRLLGSLSFLDVLAFFGMYVPVIILHFTAQTKKLSTLSLIWFWLVNYVWPIATRFRENSFNITSGGWRYRGGASKTFRHLKGGLWKNHRGLRKFVYFKTNRKGGGGGC